MKKSSQKKADILAREIGCIVCLLYRSVRGVWADIHHPAPGRKRISDDHFIALCPWHHRGIPDGCSQLDAEELYGPSLALNKKAFIAAYGTEQWLYEASEEVYEHYQRQYQRSS